MVNVTLFNWTSMVYLTSSLFYFFYLFFRKGEVGRLATGTAVLGVTLQTLAYGVRWIESYHLGTGHSPFSFFTLYETLIFACWTMALIYLVTEYCYRQRTLGALVLPLISTGMLFASLSPHLSGEIEELPSVLKGNFLAYHTVSCVISSISFLISLLMSILLLMTDKQHRDITSLERRHAWLPPAEVLEAIHDKTIAIGFIFLSIGMATGAYRTKVIWGSYWNWDPVETSALIVWLLFAIILHGRYQRWWGRRTSFLLTIIAFCLFSCCFLIAGSYIMVSSHYPIL